MRINQLTNLICFIALVATFSCATKKEDGKDGEKKDQKEWKEMDDFHMVMAETFHPFKDSANLAPAKAQASDLAASAEKWASSPLPEKVDSDEMKAKLESLKTETASLVQLATSGDDQAIGDQLTKVHNVFHTIQETWYGAGEKGHGHEHH
jgi:hypothetical protein